MVGHPVPNQEEREASVSDARLTAAADRGGAAWRRLGLRIKAITPSQLGQIVLVSAVLLALGWVVTNAWFALLPFAAGLVLAYITLPIVNRLDTVMPRALAALLVMLGEVLSVLLFFALLIPPVVDQVTNLIQVLPTLDPQDLVAEARASVAALPEPAQGAVLEAVRSATVAVRDNLPAYLRVLAAASLAGTVNVLNALGFTLGLLAIPTWIVSVMSGQRTGVRVLDGMLPGWLREDFWAVIRIFDRTLGYYIRGQAVAAMAVGAATYVGLRLIELESGADIGYPLLLAMLAGALNFVPTIGPILAAIPAVGLGFASSREVGLVVLALYIGVQQLEGMVIQSRIERKSADMHPAILVLAIVALSQFGLLWVLLAAPLTVAVRDLFRYAYGRLGDPPVPAGVLPGSASASPERTVRAPARRMTVQAQAPQPRVGA